MKTILTIMMAVAFLLLQTTQVQAQARAKLAKEAAEMLLERFGAKVGKSVPEITARIEGLAARYGEEVILAARKGGPAGLSLMEANGPKAVRILSVYGEQGATRVLSRPTAMKQFLQHGEEAAAVLVKHPGVAESMVERGGIQAVKALGTVGPQSGRRLAMLMEGELANASHHPALLEVVAKHGERAMEFIWQNKGTLAGGAALAAFLHDPEPFLNGAKDISSLVGESVVKPVTNGIFTLLNIALVGVGVLLLAIVGLMYKYGPPKVEHLGHLLHLFKK